jgi:uncharacterized protein YjbJ (UPF0337 family)
MERQMNIDTLAGEGTELKGQFKESLGNATGDTALQQDGVMDQLSGNARQAVGALRDFARNRPFAAALAGVVGLVVLGGLRQRRSRR